MFQPDRHTKAALIATMLFAALAPQASRAEVMEPGKLESLKQEVGTSLERKKALEEKAKAAAADVATTRTKLISTAAKVQTSEAAVSASEIRLKDLNVQEAALLAQLSARRARIADLLGALARLDRNPPPALAVDPNDALGAMRGAILLGQAVPELKAEADDLKNRLMELQTLRANIIAERTVLAQATLSLQHDRKDLEGLLDDKLAAQKKIAADASSEAARAKELSQEATNLTDLIAKLESQAQSRLPQSRPEPQAPKPVAATPATDAPLTAKPAKGEELALLTPPSEPSELPSSRHFSEAKGLIRLPATGLLVSGFGAPNGAGGHTEGMTIATRPGAQVVAPFDGKIVYAGPFRRYGQLLILSVGEGYHVLLAGMSEIDGQVGQSVLAGEPVGRMSAQTDEISESPQKTATDGRPSLYIEFRKDSDPIDPRPWLKMSDKKARG